MCSSPVGSTRRPANPRKCADELTDRSLSPFAPYPTETRHEIDQHALARKQLGLDHLEAFEEVLNRRTRPLRELIELTRRYAVDAALIFINLLVCLADQFAELPHGKTERHPTFADFHADKPIRG